MTSNPVKGPAPSDPPKGANDTKTASSPHRKIEKVEKVGEVDPEQQSRARKFRSMVDEEPPEDSASSQYPSPMNLFTTEDKPKASKVDSKSSFSNNEPATPIPSPAYSSPPNAASGLREDEIGEESRLPRSEVFWADKHEPITQEAPKKPTFTENVYSSPEKPGGTKKKKEDFAPSAHLGIPIKKEPSPYDLISQKEGIGIKPKKDLGKRGKEAMPPIPESVPPNTKPIKEPASPMTPHLNKEKEKMLSPTLPEQRKSFDSAQLPGDKTPKSLEKIPPKAAQNETVSWAPANPFEEKNKNQKKKEETELEVLPPSVHPLPVDIIPIATAATAAMMPYLKPETMSLFYQMVGTIYVMTTPLGVSRTEVVLNAPSYAQSKFYGASIIIEKYAAAPDSFNIRLTGSNEAVTAFNQNIPNLMTAFRQGKFSFGIGRIEAEYKDEKPLFRRKENRTGNDLGGQFTDKGRDE